MNVITRAYYHVLRRINPIKYAIKVGVNIEKNSGSKLISTNFGSEPWLITIGKHVEITEGVRFITHDGATWVLRNQSKYDRVRKFGKIIIGDNCFIGMNSIILPGVTIGRNSIIGAGSIVNKNVPVDSVYAGNPAHFICSLTEYAEKCLSNTPDYDEERYKADRKSEILRMLS